MYSVSHPSLYLYLFYFNKSDHIYFSSTPQESELTNIILLLVESDGLEQMVINQDEAETGSSLTVVDSRTRRVQIVIDEDFFLRLQAPFTIEVTGLAMVKDMSSGASSSSTLNAELGLNIEFVIEVSQGGTLIFYCYGI